MEYNPWSKKEKAMNRWLLKLLSNLNKNDQSAFQSAFAWEGSKGEKD